MAQEALQPGMFVVCGLRRCTELELIEHARSDVESTTFCAVWCSALLLYFFIFKNRTIKLPGFLEYFASFYD